jgi:hypothetical protein
MALPRVEYRSRTWNPSKGNALCVKKAVINIGVADSKNHATGGVVRVWAPLGPLDSTISPLGG